MLLTLAGASSNSNWLGTVDDWVVLPCNVLGFITLLAVRVSETDTVMSAVGVRCSDFDFVGEGEVGFDSPLDDSETKGDRVPVVLTPLSLFSTPT